MTTVLVLHNVTADDQGRPVGMLDGYGPDHELEVVLDFESFPDLPAEKETAFLEWMFHLLNVGHDPEFGEPHQMALDYRREGHRSLSVGDVVVFDKLRAYAVARFGWDSVEVPLRALLEDLDNVDPADVAATGVAIGPTL